MTTAANHPVIPAPRKPYYIAFMALAFVALAVGSVVTGDAQRASALFVDLIAVALAAELADRMQGDKRTALLLLHAGLVLNTLKDLYLFWLGV